METILVQVAESRPSNLTSEAASAPLPPEAMPLARAAYDLAVMSLTGLAAPVWPKNESLGITLLEKSAEAGDLQATLALAYRHVQGRGMEQDLDKAFRQVDIIRRLKLGDCC